MGGSGGSGGGRGNSSIEKMQEKIFKAQQESIVKVSIVKLNDIYAGKLSEYNNRDIETILKHLETVKNALEKDIDGSLSLLFGGSVSKHTYVDGISDVDILVTTNSSSLQKSKPKDVIEYFYNRLKERLPYSNIEKGNLAVTIKFKSGNEIQLLPSIRTETGIKISKSQVNEWSNVVKPKKFGEVLSNINKTQNGKVVPVIKLCKSLNDGMRVKQQLNGYHIEALAIHAFRNYNGKTDYNSMLNHLVKSISKSILTPTKEMTGQSNYIDSDLGSSNSTSRNIISKAYERVGNRINNILRTGEVHKIEDIV